MLHEFHLERQARRLNIFHLKVTIAGAPNETVMVGEGKEADVTALAWESPPYCISISDRE